MIVFPIAAAAIAFVFGAHLLVRFVRRGAIYEGVWSLALLMYSAASAALAAGVAGGWSTGGFRIYWLFGAVLNVPFLAQGELYLLLRDRRLGHALLAVLLFGTAWASAEIRSAALDTQVLTSRDFFSGREVLGEGSEGAGLARWYSLPAYGVLVAGALWSALRMRKQRGLASRFRGTLLIVVGATVVAAGSPFAADANFAGFSATLAAGATVMYLGFLTATSPRLLDRVSRL